MDLAKAFGANLRTKRKVKNISQDKLALMSDVDRSYVGRIERGEVNVTLKIVYVLANTLDCTVLELLP